MESVYVRWKCNDRDNNRSYARLFCLHNPSFSRRNATALHVINDRPRNTLVRNPGVSRSFLKPVDESAC